MNTGNAKVWTFVIIRLYVRNSESFLVNYKDVKESFYGWEEDV